MRAIRSASCQRKHRTAGLGDPDDLETPQLAPARAGSSLPGDTAPANALVHEVWHEARGLREVLERGNRS